MSGSKVVSDMSTERTIITFKGLRALEEFIIHKHTARKVSQLAGVPIIIIYALQVSWDVLADADFLCDIDDKDVMLGI
jgi:hypothetical protein